MSAAWTVLGTPSGAGACGVGQDQAPRALRDAGLIDALQATGANVEDMGDSPVTPWRPDRTMPHAQNLAAVVDAVQSTARRVAELNPHNAAADHGLLQRFATGLAGAITH